MVRRDADRQRPSRDPFQPSLRSDTTAGRFPPAERSVPTDQQQSLVSSTGRAAKEPAMQYDPPRQRNPRRTQDPLEIELVYNVRSCGTCEFFWPERSPQPYGPYPTYDFTSNTP